MYDALSHRGISAAEADKCEIWQVASMLGLSDRTASDASAAVSGGPYLSGEALLRARVAHAKGRGPKPEAMPISGDHPLVGGIRAVR